MRHAILVLLCSVLTCLGQAVIGNSVLGNASLGAGAAGGGGWEPDDEATLTGWWKADTLALSDDAAVETWTDSSSGGNDATQATAGYRPVFKTNIKASKGVVRFTAASTQYLTSAMDPPQNAFTVAAVIRVGTTTGDHAFFAGDVSDSVELRSSGNGLQFLRQAVGGGANSSVTLSSDTWYVVVITRTADDGAITWTVNGDTSGTGTDSTEPTGANTWIGGAAVGEYWQGDIAEIMQFSSVVSAATISTYLNTRWTVY